MAHSSPGFTTIHLQWKEETPAKHFRTGVSLHSHTLHSRESLAFIYRAAAATRVIAAAMRRGEEQYRKVHGTALDFSRGWWTPPLGALDAWTIERAQIRGMELDALVSLTDHDDIEAPVSLQILEECQDVPISFEWTVPYGPTFFHLGVHNLPSLRARRMFEELNEYTRAPRPRRLLELMTALSAIPGTLIVFNHPLWDESHVGPNTHTQAAQEFVRLLGPNLHALEMNGLRPWRENDAVLALAKTAGKTVVSGGDRHGLEPNANLNLTNASNFAEFAEEIRAGWSHILILPHYRERHAARIIRGVVDVLRTHERHPNGWKLWSDRVFYQCDDGRVRPLTELLGARIPGTVSVLLDVVNSLAWKGSTLRHEALGPPLR